MMIQLAPRLLKVPVPVLQLSVFVAAPNSIDSIRVQRKDDRAKKIAHVVKQQTPHCEPESFILRLKYQEQAARTPPSNMEPSALKTGI